MIVEQAVTLYKEILMSRDRLAELPPLTGRDLELCQFALHETVWFFMTPPKWAATELPLPDDVKRQLRTAAETRENDLYVVVVALIALKLWRKQETSLSLTENLEALTDLLDLLSFDHKRPKRTILETLRELKADIDARIAHVTEARAKGFAFPEPVEIYAARKNKREKPDQFFRRVYSRYVSLGLTQADIRKSDPAFYNVFHVWCSRNGRRPESYIPAKRPRRN